MKKCGISSHSQPMFSPYLTNLPSDPKTRLITSSGRPLTDASEPLTALEGYTDLVAVALQLEVTHAVKAAALWCYGGGWWLWVF